MKYFKDENPPTVLYEPGGYVYRYVATEKGIRLYKREGWPLLYSLEALLDMYEELNTEPPTEPCKLKQVIVRGELEAYRLMERLYSKRESVVLYLPDGTLGKLASLNSVALSPSGRVHAMNQVEYPLMFVFPESVEK